MRQRQNLKGNRDSIARRFRVSRNLNFAALYSAVGGLRGALGAQFPGPYKIQWEPTLTGTVVSATWRPPTLVGTPGILAPTAIVASPSSLWRDPPAFCLSLPAKLAMRPAILY